MRLPFVKMHGLGNDFIIIDTRGLDFELTPQLAADLCDRHFGVGADGVLLRFTSEDGGPTMSVINADGSAPEMCGNGLRCFVKYLSDHATDSKDTITVTTGAGRLNCQLTHGVAGATSQVCVEMGVPTFLPGRIPVAAQEPVVDKEIKAGGRYIRITAVGTGNPHGVIFASLTEAERDVIARDVASHELFPHSANIEFCQLLDPTADGIVQMQCDVLERGCGWTLACGTGATAAVAAAVKLGHISPSNAAKGVRVKLPGGWLLIAIDEQGAATMTGPATEVFRGELTAMPRRS